MKHVTLARSLFTRFIFALTLALTVSAVARAQAGEWVDATPSSVVPHQLSTFTCDGVTSVNVRWTFNNSGYRVVQPPLVARAGQTITLDVRAEESTGGIVPAFSNFDKTFELGVLEPGTYTLVVKSWGSTLKQTQFTVRQTPPAVHALDGGCFFVAQHYRDFLSREADGAGFAFWTNEVASCGTDAACIDVKRVNVSAAFFLSIEFQNTGYLVYRFYNSAYGDAASPGVAGTVPVIRLNEFLPDTQRIGRGIVVGQGAWEQQLEANKQAFALEFVLRQRFTDSYPLSMTAAQFVDKLIQNSGVSFTQGERDQLVSQLASSADVAAGRASVLRQVAEDSRLQAQERNRAFVLMQYFGYLRRNPDDAPEPGLNFAGWKFWLDKLNQFGGNFVQAEMVKAFLTSDEYIKRFGL
jgi:hypothetical protein